MKVKVGNIFYNSSVEPVMIILSNQDKENIKNMSPESTKYCAFPDTLNEENIKKWMMGDI
jgi:hypothetical protein